MNENVRAMFGRHGEIVIVAARCGRCANSLVNPVPEVMPTPHGYCPWCGLRIIEVGSLQAGPLVAAMRKGERSGPAGGRVASPGR